MAFKVIVAEPAAEDIIQTVDYIARHSSAAAKQWLDQIQSAIESLTEMPQRAPSIPENALFAFHYRHLLHQSHRIIFRVDEATTSVVVIRVYHSARTPLTAEELES